MADHDLSRAQERSTCYVYLIHHSTETDAEGNPLVVYVGKGKNDRAAPRASG